MIDEVDAAAVFVEQDRAAALAAHEAQRRRRERIEESMRPADPAFDAICRDCGQEIDARRRALLPKTNRCTPCASAAETHYRETAWKP